MLAPVFFLIFSYDGGPVMWAVAFVALGVVVSYAMLAVTLPEGMIFSSAMMFMSFVTLDFWVAVLGFCAMAVKLVTYGLSDEDAAEVTLDDGLPSEPSLGPVDEL